MSAASTRRCASACYEQRVGDVLALRPANHHGGALEGFVDPANSSAQRQAASSTRNSSGRAPNGPATSAHSLLPAACRWFPLP